MAELRQGGACAFSQSSLASVPVSAISRVSSSLERCLDTEPGLRLQRRINKNHAERSYRTRIPAVIAAATETEVENGTKQLFKLPGTLKIPNKDNNVVFVAGATGNVGFRTVKELIKLGFRVRAGVRSMEKAQNVLGEVLSSASTTSAPFSRVLSFLGFKQPEQLEFAICDLEKTDEIELALGNAGVVICAIGASEKEVLDVTGPYRIDFEATKNLVIAAKNAKVKHFVLVTSLGTTKFGWPAAVLNLFWGVLVWKAKAENVLIDSGLVYTIVRPGGMERPTDSYKETHNLRLGTKDTFTGGQISRLQVAELLACITNNLELAENKILEAIAETTAPLRPIEELIDEVPSQKTQEGGGERSSVQAAKKRKKAQEAQQLVEGKRKAEETKRKAEEEAKKAIEAKEKAAEAKKSQELRQKIAKELAELKKQEELAVAEAEKLQQRRAELAERAKAAASTAAKAEAVAKALLSAAKEGKLLTEEDKRTILLSVEAGSRKEPKITDDKVEKKPVKPVTSSSISGPKPKAQVLSTEPSKSLAETKAKNSVQESSPMQAQNKASKLFGTKSELKKTTTEKTPTKAPEVLTSAKSEKMRTKAPEVSTSAKSEKTLTKASSPKSEQPETITTKKDARTFSDQAKAREQDALSKAKATFAFTWPWQKEEVPVSETVKESSYSESPDVKPPVSPTPQSRIVSTVPQTPESELKVAAVPVTSSATSAEIKADIVPKNLSAEKEPERKTSEKAPTKVPEAPSSAKSEEPETIATTKEDSKTFSEQAKAREQDALAKAKASTRTSAWPWQKEELLAAEAGKAAISSPPSSKSEYPGVKPPVSPTPKVSQTPTSVLKVAAGPEANAVPRKKKLEETVTEKTPTKTPEASSSAKAEEPEKITTNAKAFTEQAKAREQDALAKAKASTSTFTWPWQTEDKALAAKPDTETIKEPPVSPTLQPPKEPKVVTSSASFSESKANAVPESSSLQKELKETATGKTLTKTPETSSSTKSEEPEKVATKTPEPSSAEPDEPEKEKDTKAFTDQAKAREQDALAKAKASTSTLTWPWQNEAPAYPEGVKEPPVRPTPQTSTPSTPVTPSASSGELKADAVAEVSSASSKFDPKTVKEREQDAVAKAKAATTFVWPWAKSEDVIQGKVEKASAEERKTVKQTAVAITSTTSRPLSPYWRYPDFKPPTSPTPRPPKSEVKSQVSPVADKKVVELKTSVLSTEASSEGVKEREQAALEKAKAAFTWPWNLTSDSGDGKPKESVVGSSGSTEASPRTEVVEPSVQIDKPVVILTKDVKERDQEALAKARAALAWPWTITGDGGIKEQTQTEDALPVSTEPVVTPTYARSLSPYSRYPDFKPPASPTPPPPKVETKSVVVPSKLDTEDSKVEEEQPVSKADGDFSTESTKTREQDALAKAKAAFAWPWTADKLTEQPPEEKTGSPAAPPVQSVVPPATSPLQSSVPEEKTGSPAASPVQSGYNIQQRASTNPNSSIAPTETSSPIVTRPLSPYTRYEDLKPPSSPTPSPPKITHIRMPEKTIQETSATATPTVSVTDQTAAESQARAALALEKARASTAMKWPWN